jgi:hypothetical protein
MPTPNRDLILVAPCRSHGDSISPPFPMGKGEDVCLVNAAGADNKYMVSTYSFPESIASPEAWLCR